jgi:hypothetical protein
MPVDIIPLGKRTYDLERALSFVREVAPQIRFRVKGTPKDIIDLIASARLIPNSELHDDAPLKGNERDARRILDEGMDDSRSLYVDALSLQRSLYPLSKGKDVIVVHPFLMLTWHRYDSRYHARIVSLGYPSLLSVPGIVEAPARPREYYMMQMSGKRTTKELDALFKGRFLTFDDDLTPYIGVYVLQCAFHLLFGKGLCIAPGCALYDSHRQADLMQAPKKGLCKVHRTLLGSI